MFLYKASDLQMSLTASFVSQTIGQTDIHLPMVEKIC